MATSVQLKACGGIKPYEWSVTGDIQLDVSSGTVVNVTPAVGCLSTVGATVTVTDDAGISTSYVF